MDLTVIGCSGSVPGPDDAASCYLVRAHDGERDWQVLLDLGSGALGPLQRHTDPLTLDAVLLTHLHPDHCLDLTGLHVLRRHGPTPATGDLPVWGPAGVAERMGRAHGVPGGEPMPGIAWGELTDRSPVRVGPFTITPYAVRHPVPAFGLRVEAGGTVLAYTGDTDTCDALQPLLTGADLALVEAGFADEEQTRGIHLTPARAARAVAEAGGVRRLVLTHLPPWADRQRALDQARDGWSGEICLAESQASFSVE
ncbi:MBL fold metallo-hydrolase [Serinicoccus kebangsaanensis]|uniref:MBL fold metallo-hydrolase n=1 Tax=Serinicoccus kebangsaanensis TaxID=2602069 RepID=UPI00124E9646|nr:MBL fold metallo-hydrolase [Serinicoccus kebangsaanensis]